VPIADKRHADGRGVPGQNTHEYERSKSSIIINKNLKTTTTTTTLLWIVLRCWLWFDYFYCIRAGVCRKRTRRAMIASKVCFFPPVFHFAYRPCKSRKLPEFEMLWTLSQRVGLRPPAVGQRWRTFPPETGGRWGDRVERRTWDMGLCGQIWQLEVKVFRS